MFSELLSSWRKGAGHKYIRRKPYLDKKGRKRYRYTYQAQRGGGVTSSEAMVEGSAFRLTHKGKAGHFHIENVSGDKLKIRHDESGGELELSKAEFQRLLHIEHGEALGKVADRAQAALKQAKKTGTKKQIARAKAEAEKMREIAERGGALYGTEELLKINAERAILEARKKIRELEQLRTKPIEPADLSPKRKNETDFGYRRRIKLEKERVEREQKFKDEGLQNDFKENKERLKTAIKLKNGGVSWAQKQIVDRIESGEPRTLKDRLIRDALEQAGLPTAPEPEPKAKPKAKEPAPEPKGKSPERLEDLSEEADRRLARELGEDRWETSAEGDQTYTDRAQDRFNEIMDQVSEERETFGQVAEELKAEAQELERKKTSGDEDQLLLAKEAAEFLEEGAEKGAEWLVSKFDDMPPDVRDRVMEVLSGLSVDFEGMDSIPGGQDQEPGASGRTPREEFVKRKREAFLNSSQAPKTKIGKILEKELASIGAELRLISEDEEGNEYAIAAIPFSELNGVPGGELEADTDTGRALITKTNQTIRRVLRQQKIDFNFNNVKASRSVTGGSLRVYGLNEYGHTHNLTILNPKDQEPKTKAKPKTPKAKTKAKASKAFGKLKGHEGKKARLIMPGASGRPQRHKITYALVEADSVIASHNPETFTEREDYPKGIQERDYSRDKTEQRKVVLNAQNFIPEMQVSTNPDAVNGPPILTPSGHAIGGNSRAMTVQRLHAIGDLKEQRGEYLDLIREEAASFGLDPAQVDGLKKPMLVRVLEDRFNTPDEMRNLVRVANESFTGGMSAEVKARRAGLALSPKALRVLSASLESHEGSMGSFLTTPSDKLGDVVQELRTGGMITEQNFSEMVRDTGRGQALTQQGVAAVESALSGRLVPDLGVLSNLPEGFKSKKLPQVALELAKEGKLDQFQEPITNALRAYTAMVQQEGSFEGLAPRAKVSLVNTRLQQKSLLGEDEQMSAVKGDPLTREWFNLFISMTGPRVAQRKVRAVLKGLEGESGLFPVPPKEPLDAVRDATGGISVNAS